MLSGGVRSRDTANEYVPDVEGVKAGRTARISVSSIVLTLAPNEDTVWTEFVVVVEDRITYTPLS